MKKIIFICPYPAGLAPSQRFRFEQYTRHLNENGFLTVIKPFFNEKSHFAFYQSGKLFSKIHALIKSYLRRIPLLIHARSADFIFIHREATPAGPPFVEWWCSKVLKKKVIYDFDDAIWLTDKSNEPSLTKMLRSRSKVKSICRWSDRVSCGNHYLAQYARQFNQNVVVNPTTIDTLHLHFPTAKPRGGNERIKIGWTGSHSTLKYLQEVIPVLQSLETKYPNIETLVIADRNPDLPMKSFRYVRWNLQSEIEDLRGIDIGIMPLPDDDWTRGKCGFKALQYMALGIPALVSPVGVNREIIEHGQDGYWCSTASEWFSRLEELILNPMVRDQLGKKGRQKVIERYSVAANSANFLSLFQ